MTKQWEEFRDSLKLYESELFMSMTLYKIEKNDINL